MATIALYSNQIAQMSGKLGEVKKTVGDYKSELFSLKTKALAIKQSICNMEDVISSIQASTSVQEEKVDSLEQVRGSSEQFIEDTYRIDGNVADLVNKRKDDFYDQYKYLKPDREKNFWEKRKNDLKKIGEWCKEHWKAVVTIVLVIAVIVVAVVATVMFGLPAVLAFIGKSILCGIVKSILSGIVIGGVIGGLISIATGGGFWEGFEEGAFFGAVAGGIASGMGVFFTGAVKGAVIKLWQTLVTGGASGVGAMLLSDLGDVVIKGDSMSLKKIVTDVVIAGVTGVVFAGIGYGLSKAFKALKLKMFNKGGLDSIPDKAKDIANQVKAKNGAAPQGYKGGKVYQNMPKEGAQKLPEGISYKEYDINPYVKGQNRGMERIIIGDDGSVWYTNNHYETFTRIE